MRVPLLLAAPIVLATWAVAGAQTPPTLPVPADPFERARSSLSGRAFASIDFGGRFLDVTGDPARHQRYRDLRAGGYLGDALFGRRGDAWTLSARAWNVGYRDQKYEVAFQDIGRLKVSFVWDQIPMFISRDTRTLYVESAPNVFRLDDALQQSIQAGLATLRAFEGQAVRFDTRTERRVGEVDLVFAANPGTDLAVRIRSTARSGQIPYGGSFGHTNVVEVPLRLDSRTTEVRSSLEWANTRGLVRVGWDGSWYENDAQTLIWDNPLRITDAAGLPSQGLTVLWPTNTVHYVHGTGSVSLPGRGRLTGHVAFGEGRSDAPIPAMTVNTALPVVPLSRDTTQASQQTTVAHVALTLRPVRPLVLSARVRHAGVDVQTPPFRSEGRVAYDAVYSAVVPDETKYHGVTRQTVDVDGTIALARRAALRVGYGRNGAEYANRHWRRATEHAFRVSFDTTGSSWLMVKSLFEDRRREGDGFEVAHLGAGELATIRHFDIADRNRRRATVLATLMPGDVFGVNLSAGIGRDAYPSTVHGLLEADTQQYSIGVDVAPGSRVSLNATYGWENHASLQRLRSATTAADLAQPQRDWTTDYDGRVRYVDAALEIVNAAPRTDVRFGLDWNRTRDRYLYALVPGSPLPVPEPLPPVLNELLRTELSVTYRLSDRVRLGVVYWYDDYQVEDFALGPTVLSGIALPSLAPGGAIVPTNALLLGYLYRPYTAHTGWVRLTYRF